MCAITVLVGCAVLTGQASHDLVSAHPPVALHVRERVMTLVASSLCCGAGSRQTLSAHA